MSNENNNAGGNTTSTVEQQINDLVSKATPSDKGLVLADEYLKDIPEPIAVAVKAELRLRNTQSAYTRSQQELAKTKAVATQLTQRLESSLDLGLSTEEARELKDLKVNNPDEWRKKVSVYETRARERLQGELRQIEENSTKETVVEIRKQQLAAFNESTGLQLTDDLIRDELPPKYMKDLEAGNIDFGTFLQNAADYLLKQKVIKGAKDKPENDPQLSKMNGGKTPSEEAIGGDIVKTYEKTIF